MKIDKIAPKVPNCVFLATHLTSPFSFLLCYPFACCVLCGWLEWCVHTCCNSLFVLFLQTHLFCAKLRKPKTNTQYPKRKQSEQQMETSNTSHLHQSWENAPKFAVWFATCLLFCVSFFCFDSTGSRAFFTVRGKKTKIPQNVLKFS